MILKCLACGMAMPGADQAPLAGVVLVTHTLRCPKCDARYAIRIEQVTPPAPGRATKGA